MILPASAMPIVSNFRVRPVLDAFPNSTMALSTRLMRTSYTGALAYLWQASTANTLIYPDTNGNFDRQAVISFFGSNEARIRGWYGQNDIVGFNNTATSAFSQSLLCYDGSGVFKNEGGIVTPHFVNMVHDLRNSGSAQINITLPASFMWFVATRKLNNNLTTNGMLISNNVTSGSATSFAVAAGSALSADTNGASFSVISGSGNSSKVSGDTNNTFDIYCFYRNASGPVKIRKNGVELTESAFVFSGNGIINLLGKYRGDGSFFANASCGEINYYAFYDANYITGVEANMKAYWGTP